MTETKKLKNPRLYIVTQEMIDRFQKVIIENYRAGKLKENEKLGRRHHNRMPSENKLAPFEAKDSDLFNSLEFQRHYAKVMFGVVDYHVYNQAPEHIKDDLEFGEWCIGRKGYDGSNLWQATTKLKLNRDFSLRCVKSRAKNYEYLPKIYQQDPEFILIAAENGYEGLVNALPKDRKDKELIKKLAAIYWRAVNGADRTLMKDIPFLIELAEIDVRTLAYSQLKVFKGFNPEKKKFASVQDEGNQMLEFLKIQQMKSDLESHIDMRQESAQEAKARFKRQTGM